MTTLTSRQTAREQLVTLLDTIAELQVVYGYAPMDHGGLSPFAVVISDGTRSEWPDYNREFHRFWIELYWLRDGENDNIEDYVDELSKDVRQKLYDNPEVSGVWHDLELDQDFGEMGFVTGLDGRQYRTERLRVTAFSVCDNT